MKTMNRWVKVLVVVALVAVVGLTIGEAFFTSAVVRADNSATVLMTHNARAAEIARWTAMGEYYQKLQASQAELSKQRAFEAYKARWVAIGERYQKAGEQLMRSQPQGAVQWRDGR